MDTMQAALSLLLGLFIGCSLTLLITLAINARNRARRDESTAIPIGVREVLAGIDDAATVLDASGTVQAISAAGEAFGLREGEQVPDPQVRELARTARANSAPAAETMSIRRGASAAETRVISARAVPLSQRLVLVIMRDITERERVEQMRRDFVANTSHELKTPVGAVSLLAEAIESAADDPEQVRVFSRRLTAEVNRLSSLTSRIMNLSRLQAADELGEVREVPVDEFVASAIEANAIQAGSAGVELVRGGMRGLYVRGDRQVLAEAIGNLIANAIAYSPRGSSVGVGVKAVADTVEIAVTDRGIGIPDEEQERIFERFYRTDHARSRRTGGTGLGLSIVKHAVQRHGGEVRLWSRPGRGSTFTVSIPIATVPADTSFPVEKRPRKPKKKKPKNPNGVLA
ncbi:ATP-binding protein [Microbacterium sp. X-17]|uniref:sensor histidine kinase n=1 Tax=Microbacterium sp. X-17 TaxID=3144404 RepID=UPI0031F56467